MLRVLRLNAGWTLRDLADRLGVSNAYLSRVENGHDGPPTPDRLAELSKLLGLPSGKLIELADSVAPTAPNYLARVPAARDLFHEIVRRELSPVDLARVRAFVEREFPMPGSNRDARAILDMLSPERVVLRVACADLDDVIDIAAAKLASPSVSARTLSATIRAHERECPTAIGGGLAVPYGIVENAEPALAIVTLKSPLYAGSPDRLPVRLALVHTHHGPPTHTRILARLADLADEPKVRAICNERTATGVVRALRDLLTA